SAIAVAFPMPVFPPVMTTVLPCMSAFLPCRAVSVTEPATELLHPGALLVGRAARAPGHLGRASGGAPAYLDAIVGVAGHLEARGALDDVAEAELDRASVAAHVGEASAVELAGKGGLEGCLVHLADEAVGIGRRALREAA